MPIYEFCLTLLGFEDAAGWHGCGRVYLWASEAAFNSTLQALLAQIIVISTLICSGDCGNLHLLLFRAKAFSLKAVRAVAQATLWYNNDCNERLLLHVSYSPRRCSILLLLPSSFSFRLFSSSLRIFVFFFQVS